MVHNSWTLAYGNKSELRTTAELLDKIDGTIHADYMRKTAATAEQVTTWMDATTWFTAQEALAAKFIDVIDPNTKQGSADAKWNLSAYPNAPKTPEKPPEPDLTALAAQQTQLNRNRLRLITPI
jgi:ATP-dependent Clp protease protease subunit